MSTNNKIQLNSGITLIEILLVIGLVSIVITFGLFVSMDSYNNSSFNNDRTLYISALMHARSQAINNVCIGTCTDGKAHGVHIDMVGGAITQYVIFQGTTYNAADPVNEQIKTNHFITTAGATDVDFTELSGNVSAPTSITLTDGAMSSSTITIGTEGQISWTN